MADDDQRRRPVIWEVRFPEGGVMRVWPETRNQPVAFVGIEIFEEGERVLTRRVTVPGRDSSPKRIATLTTR